MKLSLPVIVLASAVAAIAVACSGGGGPTATPEPTARLFPTSTPNVSSSPVTITGDTPTPLPTDIGRIASAQLYTDTAMAISDPLLDLLGRFQFIDFEQIGSITGTATPDQQEMLGASVGIARDFNSGVDEVLTSLRSIVPPSSCAAFHDALVEFLDNIASVMRQWELDAGTGAGAPSRDQVARLRSDYSRALVHRQDAVEAAADCE